MLEEGNRSFHGDRTHAEKAGMDRMLVMAPVAVCDQYCFTLSRLVTGAIELTA